MADPLDTDWTGNLIFAQLDARVSKLTASVNKLFTGTKPLRFGRVPWGCVYHKNGAEKSVAAFFYKVSKYCRTANIKNP